MTKNDSQEGIAEISLITAAIIVIVAIIASVYATIKLTQPTNPASTTSTPALTPSDAPTPTPTLVPTPTPEETNKPNIQSNLKIEPNATQTSFVIKKDGKEVGKISTKNESQVKVFKQTQNNIYLGVEPLGLGGYILYGGPQTLYKLDLKTNALSKINIVPNQGFFTDVSPDETRVAYINLNSPGINPSSKAEENVIVENITSGLKQLFGASLKYKVLGDALFSPDGKKIAYVAAVGNPEKEAGAVFIVDIASGKETTIKTKTGEAFHITKWIDNDTLNYN